MVSVTPYRQQALNNMEQAIDFIKKDIEQYKAAVALGRFINPLDGMKSQEVTEDVKKYGVYTANYLEKWLIPQLTKLHERESIQPTA